MSKHKRHSPDQIVRKLQEANHLLNMGKSLAHVFQALEVSEATYHRWRNQYGGTKCRIFPFVRSTALNICTRHLSASTEQRVYCVAFTCAMRHNGAA